MTNSNDPSDKSRNDAPNNSSDDSTAKPAPAEGSGAAPKRPPINLPLPPGLEYMTECTRAPDLFGEGGQDPIADLLGRFDELFDGDSSKPKKKPGTKPNDGEQR